MTSTPNARRCAALGAGALLVWAAAMGGALAQPSPDARRGASDGAPRRRSDYDVLTRRNMFLSTRRPASAGPPPRPRPIPRPVPPTPRVAWVLRGILADPAGYVAVIEKTGGELLWVRAGETAAGRTVDRIDLDRIWLTDEAGQGVPVAVGQTLSGAAPDATAAGAAGRAEDETTETQDADTESILERLRRQRAAERENR